MQLDSLSLSLGICFAALLHAAPTSARTKAAPCGPKSRCFAQAEKAKLAQLNPSDLETHEAVFLLTVDKSKLRADLSKLEDNGSSTIVSSFRIAIGTNSGDKVKQGDKKTPEGIYFATKHIDTSTIQASKYGDMAIELDFPNPIDRADEKTGYGIWIHGAGDDGRIAKAQVTEGCIAFYNADIKKITNWILPRQGIVAISQSADQVNTPGDVKQVQELSQQWLNAWESRDLDSYIGFYDNSFRHEGKDKEGYRNHKQRIFNKYKDMSVGVSDLRVVSHPKYAVSVMHQDFRGDNFTARGRKILYWKREAGSWKIVHESFTDSPFHPISYKIADLKTLQTASSPESWGKEQSRAM